MGNIYEYQGYVPVIDESAFIHPTASVIGNVIIGRNVYIGPGASLRGDFGEIIVEDGCNVQDNCIVHMFPGVTVLLRENAHIGHGAIVHGSHIGRNALIGMNAVIMDNVRIGDNSIVGALCFIKEGMDIPERKLVVGNPAKIIRDVDDRMLEWKTEGTRIYHALPAECHATMRECQPLRTMPAGRNKQPEGFKTWRDTKEK